MGEEIAIDEFLRSLGLQGENAALARGVLEHAGLTNPRKQRMAAAKTGPARNAIDAEIARVCRRCAADAPAGARVVVIVPAATCARCGGSANVRALDDLAVAARAAGLRRLVVVGGSPDVRREFGRLHGKLELRLVDGTERRSKRDAERDVVWADVIVVAGASELAHRVSDLYTRDAAARGKLVISSRRGVEAIAGEVVRHLGLRK
jgi:hypothetical protein